MVSRAVLAAGVLLIFAGCVAGPFGGLFAQSEPVTVVVETSGNLSQPYTFEVWVMQLPGNVTVHRSDGRVYTTEIGEGSRTYDSGDYHNYTKIDLPPSARLHGRYRLAPGERNRSQIQSWEAPEGTRDRFPPHFAVVIIVYEEPDTIPGWKSNSDCDELDLTFVKVTMRYYGTASAFSCS